jgi:hypothetical protein
MHSCIRQLVNPMDLAEDEEYFEPGSSLRVEALVIARSCVVSGRCRRLGQHRAPWRAAPSLKLKPVKVVDMRRDDAELAAVISQAIRTAPPLFAGLRASAGCAHLTAHATRTHCAVPALSMYIQ